MSPGERVAGLERVVIDVDADGHVTATIDGEPWTPPSVALDEPAIHLGRSDVPWLLDRLIEQRDRPMHMTLHDRGQTYTDLVVPQSVRAQDPSYSMAPPGYAPHLHRVPLAGYSVEAPPLADPERPGPGIDGGGFDPDEPVAIALIVARTEADESGEVIFRVPEALRSRVGLLLMYGLDSGVTLHFGTDLHCEPEPPQQPAQVPAHERHRHADFGRDFGPGTP